MPTCECCRSERWTPLFEENQYQLGVCASCKLHYVSPMPPHGARMTEIESGHFADGQEVLIPIKQLAAERAQASRFQGYVNMVRQLAPSGRWLDIGCGAGLLIELAQQSRYACEGIELTAGRREIARLTAATIHSAPVEDLEFPNDSFDVVSLINVFSHLVRPGQTIRELSRILRPGGVILIVTAELRAGLKKDHMTNWSLGDHLHFLGHGTMERYASQAGLTVAQKENVWYPDAIYTREQFSVKGRSPLRNAIKAGFVIVPGALPLLRYIMKRWQRDNAVYPSVYLLQHVLEPSQ